MAAKIGTRLLILSDMHGENFSCGDRPYQRADVALHCGDLTDNSKLEEFQSSKIAELVPPLEPEDAARHFGTLGQARQLFEDARSEGIVFLDEGTHHFTLENGAKLKIYASPYTPALGDWAFQYRQNQGRKFDIEEEIDIVMTHGPPKGIMDITYGRDRAGCRDLFSAVAHARPRIHCFGHIHGGWGAKAVTWKDSGFDEPSHFTAIDNGNSQVIESLATLRPHALDSDERAEEKRARLEQLAHDKCAITSHCTQDKYSLQEGKETLFINAAIKGEEGFVQRPWLVDIELPKHTEAQEQ